MVGRLDGKVALISGSARGQGAAEARLFAREGAKVVVSDVLVEHGQAVAAEIVDGGGDAIFVELDVRREEQWAQAVEAALRSFGKLDVLVNNAGILVPDGLEATSLALWERTIAINLTGTFLGMKAAVPAMRAAGGGAIVNISSGAGLIGTGGSAAYHASKGGVRLLSKTVAVEYAAENIRVNSVYPGVIDTDMVTPIKEDLNIADVIAAHPIGRLGTVEEIAYGVLYLASDESSFLIGSELVIDGGFTAR